jgi:hypothetical protein
VLDDLAANHEEKVDWSKSIAELIAPLEAGAGQLVARVAALEKRLNMNSSNTSKPPSSPLYWAGMGRGGFRGRG